MIKAIPTEYKGIVFRSKLEAQTAVLLDAVGAEWVYEPETFQLHDGRFYLPDFQVFGFLGEAPCFYIEVKGCFNQGRDDESLVLNFSKPIIIIDRILPLDEMLKLEDNFTLARGAKELYTWCLYNYKDQCFCSYDSFSPEPVFFVCHNYDEFTKNESEKRGDFWDLENLSKWSVSRDCFDKTNAAYLKALNFGYKKPIIKSKRERERDLYYASIRSQYVF